MQDDSTHPSGAGAERPSKRRDWMHRLARHRTGLAALSFAESTVVPIPLETIVIPLMVGHPRQAISIATAIWIGCLAGASLFYFAALWLFEPVVQPALEALGLAGDFQDMVDRLGSDGLFWTVFLTSVSPAPMQLATLGAGAAKASFLVFFSAIAISRGIRYFGLAILAQIVGPRLAELEIPRRYLIPGMAAILLVIWGVLQVLG